MHLFINLIKEIRSCKIQRPINPKITTAFALINYEKPENALNAVQKAKSEAAITKLFLHDPFITYHKNKIESLKEKKSNLNRNAPNFSKN